MIVRMKKITLLCMAEHRDATLAELRDLGVLHLAPARKPESADVDRALAELHRTEAVASALRAFADDAVSSPAAAASAEAVDAAGELLALRNEIEERIEDLAVEKEEIEPLGHFDPGDIHRLREAGVTVRLYRCPGDKSVKLPEGVVSTPIGLDGGRILALAGAGDFEFAGEELPLPERPLKEVEDELKAARRKMDETVDKLRHTGASLPSIEAHAAELRDLVAYLKAEAGMGHAGEIAYLRGFCPEDRVRKLRESAGRSGWGLLIEEPADDEPVPTLVRYARWVRMIKPMFRFLGIVPGYRETDISSSFLVFLSVFFAMIVGDAGYGLLFLILTPYARAGKFASSPPEPFRLLYLFSAGTVIWGVLTGNYFGIDFEYLPGFLRALRVDWLTSQNNSMTLSLLLGGIHLTLAHGWKAIRYGMDPRTLVQAGWICVVWGIFALARLLLVGARFPVGLAPVPVLGLAAIVAGLIRTRQWMDMGLLLLDLVSCFGDLMSYLRLFALGIASVKVAEAFNGMAGDLGMMIVGTVSGAGPALWTAAAVAATAMALVLMLGHGLNIILCAMSVLVHGVRLNALEFSLHMGQEWSGFNYKPFGVAGAAEAA